MKYIIAILLALPFATFAGPRIELGAGQCSYIQSGNGKWWLGDVYEKGSMKTSCSQIGVSWLTVKRSRRSNGWRIAYVNLGKPGLLEVAWGGPGVQPHWTATGYGEFEGVSFGAVTEWSTNWNPSLELGLFAYRSQWHATAVHHASGGVNTFSTPASTRLSWYAGAGIAYPVGAGVALTATARYYSRLRSENMESGGDTVGPKYADVFSFLLGVRYEFK